MHDRPRHPDQTLDLHLFATRDYDLVKEFAVALGAALALSLLLAAVFSSPDRKAVTLKRWASVAPNDVVATATVELAGTSTSATYGPPYNNADDGQKLGPLALQRWAGVTTAIDSAQDLVIAPLNAASRGDPALSAALRAWAAAPPQRRTAWASAYSDALAAAPAGNPAAVKSGAYGPVPVLAARYQGLARSGGLDSIITKGFYPTDQTKTLLLLSDGAYLEQQARAQNLGGDQWGMMNEIGNYPGQPWMWLYTFWYRVKPFSTSGNADALVWGLMAVLTAGLILLPIIPGLRSLPRHLGVHKLIWRYYWRGYENRPRNRTAGQPPT